MCGRFIVKTPPEELARRFRARMDAEAVSAWKPRYNISPGQGILCVFDDRDRKCRSLDYFHWGLVPKWADDPDIGWRLTNARAETAAEKPAFRDALRYRRCLVPADGFYEWKVEGGVKQPHFIRLRDAGAFALAGLWEHWSHPGGSEILSCALLTTRPNKLMATIHDRMPVILPAAAYDTWLDSTVTDAAAVRPLLRPFPAEAMEAWPVGPEVGNTRNDSPSLLDRHDYPRATDFFDKLFPSGPAD